MNKKIIVILFSAMTIATSSCLASYQEQANQVSQITGVAPNKVAKMAEAIEKMKAAREYAHGKQYSEAIRLASEITIENGFDYEDERHAGLTLIGIKILAGEYMEAKQITDEMNGERPLLDDFVAYIHAISDFSVNKDKNVLLDYAENYNSKNKNIIPPKMYELSYLSRMVRLYEMANEIDRALDLVEKYYQLYYPNGKPLKKKLSAIGERKREGVTLLKEALLRDKREEKNIYAQELINTTDYFGFV